MKAKTHFFYQKFPIPGFRLTRIFTKNDKTTQKRRFFAPFFSCKRKIHAYLRVDSCLSSFAKHGKFFPKDAYLFRNLSDIFPKTSSIFPEIEVLSSRIAPIFLRNEDFHGPKKYPIKPILSKQLSSKSAFSTQREAHRFNFSEISPEIIKFQKG